MPPARGGTTRPRPRLAWAHRLLAAATAAELAVGVAVLPRLPDAGARGAGSATASSAPTSVPPLVQGSAPVADLLAEVRADLARAVPEVSAAWGGGRDWARHLSVVVASSPAELGLLVGAGPAWEGFVAVALPPAAVASAPVAPAGAPAERAHAGVGGGRIVIDGPAWRRLSAAGRRIVLTHELTHLATATATGPATPAWLVEGFADFVAYRAVPLPVDRAAAELAAQVRRQGVPTRLPTGADLSAGSRPADLAASYEQAWLAVRLLARRSSPATVAALYRAVGGGVPLERALRSGVGLSLAQLTALWRQALAARWR